MITNYEKFRLQDEAGQNELLIEVNFNGDKDEKTNNCKIFKFILPDGKEALVKREYLTAMLFACGDAEEQRKMIPQKIVRTKWYETVVSVKATKDISKGEQITFPIKLSLPSTEEEVIAELKREKLNRI